MNDLNIGQIKYRAISQDVIKHDRTRCGKKKWYVKALKRSNKVIGVCTWCGKIVEQYIKD